MPHPERDKETDSPVAIEAASTSEIKYDESDKETEHAKKHFKGTESKEAIVVAGASEIENVKDYAQATYSPVTMVVTGTSVIKHAKEHAQGTDSPVVAGTSEPL